MDDQVSFKAALPGLVIIALAVIVPYEITKATVKFTSRKLKPKLARVIPFRGKEQEEAS